MKNNNEIKQLNRMLNAECQELKNINNKIKSDSVKKQLQLENMVNELKLKNENLNSIINNYKRYFSLIDKFRNSILYKLLRKIKNGKKSEN